MCFAPPSPFGTPEKGEPMMQTAILLLSVSGLSALMLSMPQHQRNWLGSALPASSNRRFRWGGFVLAALALVAAIAASGWGEGITTWFGWETVAAALIVGANAFRDRKGRGRK